MKKILAVAAAFSLVSLAACGGDTASEDAAEDELNAAGDAMEEQADLAEEAGDEATADQLEVQADDMAQAADEVDGGDDLTDDVVTEDVDAVEAQ